MKTKKERKISKEKKDFLVNRVSWKYLMRKVNEDKKENDGLGIANITDHLLRCNLEILKELQFINDKDL